MIMSLMPHSERKTTTKMATPVMEPSAGPDNCSFPVKLHKLLQDADLLGFQDIISWQPNRKSFKVRQQDRFESEILGKYFNQTKFKSFQRQLNIYGFRRVQIGADKGAYSHPLFVWQHPELCDRLQRKTGAKKAKAQMQESPSSPGGKITSGGQPSQSPRGSPDSSASGSSVSHDGPYSRLINQADSSGLSPLSYASRLDALATSAAISTHRTAASVLIGLSRQGSSSSSQSTFNTSPHLLSRTAYHGINAYTRAAVGYENQNAPQAVHEYISEDPTSTSDRGSLENVFPCKLHTVLHDAEKDGFEHIISWVADGTAFKVHDINAFVERIMPIYFDQTKYESFRRQLNIYGFVRVKSRGVTKNQISHPDFIRGDRARCRLITRKYPSNGGNSGVNS